MNRTITVRQSDSWEDYRYEGPATTNNGMEVEVMRGRRDSDDGAEAETDYGWIPTDKLRVPMTRAQWEDEQACRGDYEYDCARDDELTERRR